MEWTDLRWVQWWTEGMNKRAGANYGDLKHKSWVCVCVCVLYLLVQFIKVQIRQDLALDVSAAPADKSLSALPPQAATPVLPVVRPTARPSELLQTHRTPQAIVEISNKTIVFPSTSSGENSGRDSDWPVVRHSSTILIWPAHIKLWLWCGKYWVPNNHFAVNF